MGRFIHPRVEPEIAFLIGTPLAGVVTPLQAQTALAGVAPAMEIIDSRYENFKFSLADVVADNASSSGLVVGSWQTPRQAIENLGMVMSFDPIAGSRRAARRRSRRDPLAGRYRAGRRRDRRRSAPGRRPCPA